MTMLLTGGVGNPHGRTKLQIAQMLVDLGLAEPRWRIVQGPADKYSSKWGFQRGAGAR